MCPPNYYRIEYEINPWMDRRRQADREAAFRQWRGLRQLLEARGAEIHCLTPQKGLPDLVFTANAALVYRERAVLAHFRPPQRRKEEPYVERWLRASGFHICRLDENAFFEGAGDALFCGETLFVGYRIRSDIHGCQELAQLLDCQVIPLELRAPRFYHLDTCFCPLAPGAAVYYPPAFDEYARRVLRSLIDDLIPVTAKEAAHFACNAVVLGKTVITNTECPHLHYELRRRGFEPRATCLDEFVKAGGSAKCLTLRLDGEEAAAWRQLAADGAGRAH